MKEQIALPLSWVCLELVEVRSVLRDQIPVIRRFSGGGTVIVDQGTIFVTLICNKDSVPDIQPFPRSIMSWSGQLYSEVFEGIGDFHLRENDYVFGDRKFGGNAQSIIKHRWVHHTSFLWDYEVKNMAYLKLPAKVPNYRLARGHTDFVCRMKEFLPRSEFVQRTIKAIRSRFSLEPVADNIEDIDVPSATQFAPSTRLLTDHDMREVCAASV
ncbi:uncharacterized protein LOC114758554 isoform X3 [Neltuma alba]|uniref:uncharacterized protein LOC114758554 isoform X3 n=1 Tax=Neltuma alba TaxID=207710 RepID=UPI0010A333B0|nr:uncharacterized protein LOC114758554 isoform X3 [Prosopis alba]